MKAKDAVSSLVLMLAVLTAVVSGCGPAPLAVADPERPTTSPGLESDEALPVATDEAAPVPTIAEPEPSATEAASEAVAEDETDVVAEWSVLRDEEYEFEIAYPPEWGFMDLPVHDPGADGPPTVIERFVILYPQEWEERLTPGGPPDPNVASYPALSIEVCFGTLEAYRREFMELGVSELVNVNGFSALREHDTYDDYNLTRYIFQHPSKDQVIISLTDAVSGFSARAAENAEVVSLIPLVAETFAFTD